MHKLWWGLTPLILALGCVVPTPQKEGLPEIPAGMGQIVLKWSQEASRTVLGSAWAASKADAYELVLWGAGGPQSVSLGGISGQAVAVVPGTWRVVLLAGIKRSSGSSTAYLVGSAVLDGVSVTLGQRTSVNLVLKSVDLGWSVPADGAWNAPITVGATGASRNPRVGMSLAGASTTQRPRFKSIDLWNGYREMATVTGTPDDWAATATGTLPGSGTALTVQLVGAGLVLQDASDQWVAAAGLTTLTWVWPNRPDVTDTHPLVPYTEATLPYGPPPTGLDVGVTWE